VTAVTVDRWQPGQDVTLPPWTMSPVGQRVYEQLGPYTAGDADGGWVLAAYVDGLARGVLSQLEDLAADRDDGTPGVVAALDPDRAPRWMLAWLGQLVGVRVDRSVQGPDATVAQVAEARQAIRDAPYWSRGTLGYLRSVTAELLASGGEVRVRERYDPANPSVDSPHHLEVAVRFRDVLPEWTSWRDAPSNLVRNPSGASDASGWSGVGGAVSRSASGGPGPVVTFIRFEVA